MRTTLSLTRVLAALATALPLFLGCGNPRKPDTRISMIVPRYPSDQFRKRDIVTSSGFLVGQVVDTSRQLRSRPILLVTGSHSEETPTQVSWYEDGFFSMELAPGNYRLTGLVIGAIDDTTGNRNSKSFFNLPVSIPFKIGIRSVSNLGSIQVRENVQHQGSFVVQVFDNSPRLSELMFGASGPKIHIPLVLAPPVNPKDPIVTTPFNVALLSPQELRRLAALSFRTNYIPEPFFSPCIRVPGFCYKDDVGYAPRWNWQDQNAYTNYYNISLLPPWGADAHLGVNVTNDSHPTNQGWRLYTKRMSCADYNVDCTSQSNTSHNVNDGPMPYFVLYNVHTGLLRTFIYINKANYTADQELVANIGVVQEGLYAPDIDYGTDLLANSLSLSISENPQDLEPIVYITPAIFQKWVVIDQEVSYSPTKPIPNGLLFSFNFDGIAETAVTLSGELHLEKQTVVPNSKGGIGTVWDKRKKVSQAYNSPADWAQAANKQGEKLGSSSTAWKQELGASLVAAASYASAASPYVGAALAAYQIFSAFSGGSGGGVQSEFFDGAISLEGSLKHQHPVDVIKFGVHQSSHANATNQSELASAGRIGLWSLKSLPSMDAYLDGIRMGPFKVQDLVSVNPAANMELITAEASILIDFNHYVACPNGVRVDHLEKPVLHNQNDGNLNAVDNSFWRNVCDWTEIQGTSTNFVRQSGDVAFDVIDAGKVEAEHLSPNLTPTDIPHLHTYVRSRNKTARIRASTMLSHNPELLVDWRPHLYWLLEDEFNGYDWSDAVAQGHLPMAKEAYIKVYLFFVHKDDRTLYHEFVRTFKVNIVRHNCTLRKHNVSKYDPVPPPRC